MAEGVAIAGGKVVGEPTFDDPKKAPPEDRVAAPQGWTWDRNARRWRAKKRPGRGGRQEPPADPSSNSGDVPPSDRDPDPPWSREPESGADDGRGRQLSFDDIPQAVKDDIAGFAGLIGAPILGMLQAADPYCGTALAQSFEPIVDAVLPLVCRSEKIVSYFSGDKSDWLLWGKLAMALAPVARAVYDHHIAHTVHLIRDPETGQVQVMRGRPQESEYGDHLTPPQPDFSGYRA